MVTVVIPVFNRENKIKRAVKSATGQTFEDIEVLVIDDGSEDRTYEVASKLKDSRVEAIKLEKNFGVSRARNVGIKKSKRKYIAFLDSDDEWNEDKIEKQLKYISGCEKEIDIVDCNWVIKSRKYDVRMTKKQDGPTNRRKLLSFQHICSPPTVIARRSALEEVGGFDESISTAEDADLWVRLSKNYEFGHVPEALVEVHRGHKRRLGLDLRSFIKGHLRFYAKHKQKYEGERKLKSKFFFNVGRILMSMGEHKNGRKYVRRSIEEMPYGIKKYAFLAASYLGKEAYESISDVKNTFSYSMR